MELADYEQTFLHQADQVNQWDRLLMENGEKVRVRDVNNITESTNLCDLTPELKTFSKYIVAL